MLKPHGLNSLEERSENLEVIENINVDLRSINCGDWNRTRTGLDSMWGFSNDATEPSDCMTRAIYLRIHTVL
jgi:hypothetical protein